jgi:hypothetical protein
VLANAESRRRRTKATEVDDVVRAAIGEVDDYRRIDVLNLDQLQVRGAVVADISHLLAELLDNASSFSPPESRVTVSGRYADEDYLISIADEGVGISADRLVELNDILAHPPIVGLSVEPTLGMSVVSLLAHKHSVEVRLVPASPGLLVEVVLPAALHELVDTTGLLGDRRTSNGDDWAARDTVVDRIAETTPTDTFVPNVITAEPTYEPEPTIVDEPEFEPIPPFTPEPAFTAEPEYTPEPDYTPEPAFTAEPAFTSEPTGDWLAEDATPTVENTLVTAWSTAPERTVAPDPFADAVQDEPEQESAFDLDPFGFNPPSARDRLSGEFDRPPAPPAFGTPPMSRPFTDPTARPIPVRRTEAEREAANGLPIRERGIVPEGPDRLAHLNVPAGQPLGHDVPIAPTNPSSLRTALTAFETGRAGARPEIVAPTATLPTRDPGSAFDHDEVTTSTSQSRLDPEAIRERLRSFRKEFQLGRDGEGAAGPDGDQTDLGGDR